MKSETYNGWTNYETWCVNLWLTNEQESELEMRQIAADVWDDFPSKDAARLVLADRLDNWIDSWREDLPETNIGMFHDLLTAALQRVDWLEIADSLLEDFQESPEVTL